MKQRNKAAKPFLHRNANILKRTAGRMRASNDDVQGDFMTLISLVSVISLGLLLTDIVCKVVYLARG